MNHSQTAALLALCAAYDRRTIGDADVAAWQQLLADTSYDDAVTVVRDHYARTRDWIMPVDVLAGVKRIRNDRLDRTEVPPPPAEWADDYAGWLRHARKAIADGREAELPVAVEGTRRDVAGLLEEAFRRPA